MSTQPTIDTDLHEWMRDEIAPKIARLGGTVTARQVRRRLWRFRTAGGALLECMVKAELGHFEQRPTGPRGGRPTRVFILDAIASPKQPQQPAEQAESAFTPHGVASENSHMVRLVKNSDAAISGFVEEPTPAEQAIAQKIHRGSVEVVKPSETALSENHDVDL